MSDEEQRQHVIEVVRRETGVDCPELEVVRARAILGGGIVYYRCKEGAPSDTLMLTPEDARYVGIDMSVRSRPETGGQRYPRVFGGGWWGQRRVEGAVEPNRENIEDLRHRYGYDEDEAEAAYQAREVWDRFTKMYQDEASAAAAVEGAFGIGASRGSTRRCS